MYFSMLLTLLQLDSADGSRGHAKLPSLGNALIHFDNLS